MNPPTEQLVRDYLNRLSVAAKTRLEPADRQTLLDQTRARIEADCGGMRQASTSQIRRILFALGDPIALVEHHHAVTSRANGSAKQIWPPAAVPSFVPRPPLMPPVAMSSAPQPITLPRQFTPPSPAMLATSTVGAGASPAAMAVPAEPAPAEPHGPSSTPGNSDPRSPRFPRGVQVPWGPSARAAPAHDDSSPTNAEPAQDSGADVSTDLRPFANGLFDKSRRVGPSPPVPDPEPESAPEQQPAPEPPPPAEDAEAESSTQADSAVELPAPDPPAPEPPAPEPPAPEPPGPEPPDDEDVPGVELGVELLDGGRRQLPGLIAAARGALVRVSAGAGGRLLKTLADAGGGLSKRLGRFGSALLRTAARDRLETFAVLVLGVGGAAYPPIWLIGAAIVMTSRKWDLRDKWLALGLPVFAVILGACLVVGFGGAQSLGSYVMEAWLAAGRLSRIVSVLGAMFLLWRLYKGRRAQRLPPWHPQHWSK